MIYFSFADGLFSSTLLLCTCCEGMLFSSALNEAVTRWSRTFSGDKRLMKSFILIKETWKIILRFRLFYRGALKSKLVITRAVMQSQMQRFVSSRYVLFHFLAAGLVLVPEHLQRL